MLFSSSCHPQLSRHFLFVFNLLRSYFLIFFFKQILVADLEHIDIEVISGTRLGERGTEQNAVSQRFQLSCKVIDTYVFNPNPT